jgi:hypothetical protein
VLFYRGSHSITSAALYCWPGDAKFAPDTVSAADELRSPKGRPSTLAKDCGPWKFYYDLSQGYFFSPLTRKTGYSPFLKTRRRRMMIPQMEPWFGEEEATAVCEYMRSGGRRSNCSLNKGFNRKILLVGPQMRESRHRNNAIRKHIFACKS